MVSVTCGAGGPCSPPLALAVSWGFNQSIRPCPISSPGHPDRDAVQRNGSFVLPAVERVAVNRLRLYAGTLIWSTFYLQIATLLESRRVDSNRLPLLITSGNSRVAGVCRGLHIPHR